MKDENPASADLQSVSTTMNKTIFMLEDKIIAFTKFVSKLILLIVTLVFIFGFAIALSEKIKRPNYKNLSFDEFITLGLIIMVLVILNLFVFGIIFKKTKND